MHTAITHVISALERQSVTCDYVIGIHVRLQPSNTVITGEIAVCNVQSGLKTLKRLYEACGGEKSQEMPGTQLAD